MIFKNPQFFETRSFGMLTPGRQYSATSSYRYGFNGKENDNEVKGEGDQQDYGMRIYDPRLGKFLSVDPLTHEYPELTPYQFASNTPIQAVDLDGMEGFVSTGVPLGNSGVSHGMIISPQMARTINEKHPEVSKGILLVGAVTADIVFTKGWATRTLLMSEGLGTLYHNPAKTKEQARERGQQMLQAAKDIGTAYTFGKVLGPLSKAGAAPQKIPQGLTGEEFKIMSQRIANQTANISTDVVVQGSRAAGTASESSDIDIAIKVIAEQFDNLIKKAFGTPNPGSALERTMNHAIETGKIQAGEAGLSSLRKNLQKFLGKDVDISIIKAGGKFDNGVQIPIQPAVPKGVK